MTSKKSLLALNFLHVLLDGLYDSIPVLLALIVGAESSADTIVGTVTSIAALASTVAGLATISFSSRFNLMQATAVILLIGGIGFLMVAFSGGIWLVGLGFILVALGQNVFHNMAFSFFTQITDRASLGRVISDFTAIGDLGRIPLVSFASLVGAMSINGIAGWRWVSFSFGAITVLLFIVSYTTLFRADKRIPKASTGTRKQLPSFGIIRDKKVCLTVVANMLNAISCGSLFAFLPLLLLSKGFAPQALAGFAFGFTLGCFVGKIACGRLIDRFGSQKTFIVAQLLLSVLLLLLLSGNNFYSIVALSLLIGIVTKGSVPIIQTLATEYIARDKYDDIFSINSFFRGAVLIIIPLLFGFLASVYGIHTIYMIMAIVSAIATLPILLVGSVR